MKVGLSDDLIFARIARAKPSRGDGVQHSLGRCLRKTCDAKLNAN